MRFIRVRPTEQADIVHVVLPVLDRSRRRRYQCWPILLIFLQTRPKPVRCFAGLIVRVRVQLVSKTTDQTYHSFRNPSGISSTPGPSSGMSKFSFRRYYRAPVDTSYSSNHVKVSSAFSEQTKT